MKFNINNYVEIKLTNDGLKVYHEHFSKYQGTSYKQSISWLDKYNKGSKKGYHKFQLWDLMSIFGPKLYMGGPNLFDLEIFIEDEYRLRRKIC